MRKFLLIAAATALALSCSSAPHATSAPPPAGPAVAPSPNVVCSAGFPPSHTAPIVCIDATTLDASKAYVHRAVWVHFYLSNQSQRLDIDFGNAPVEYKGKSGNEVWVRVKDQAQYGTYKYTAYNLDTGNSRDPDIVIEP